MNYKKYKRIKIGNCQSVGTFGDNIYAYEVLTGICNIPEYYQITEAEFKAFDEWKNETPSDLGILYDIVNRVPLCSGYHGLSENTQVSKELRCSECNMSFLVNGGDIPENIDVKKICPKCNSKPEPKLKLMLEVKKQLEKAGIRIKNLGQLFSSYYINPYSKQDMDSYVDIENFFYYLRVNERGKVIYEYKVRDVQMAAYWILKHLVYTVEYQQQSKEMKYGLELRKNIEEKCEVHFRNMEPVYWKWYQQKIEFYNFCKIVD